MSIMHELFTYDPDTGIIAWKVNRSHAVAGDEAGFLHRRWGYRVVSFTADGKTHKVNGHRVAWCLHYGALPGEGVQVDHINGVRADNRICNLRLATPQQNRMNERQRGKNPKGVSLFKCRGFTYWRARIKKDGKEIHLGYFKDQSDAKAAYDAAAAKMFGEFARTA